VRDELIVKAVNEFGYSQVEVPDVLGPYYSTISRVITDETSKIKTSFCGLFTQVPTMGTPIFSCSGMMFFLK
jgi:hypothetical protein